ncbi:hypothetical protein [Phytomonospora endophytica]|uniref:Lipoprotein n=1 Tax=Phytomonospora endophytica TaxID=714109 RepID=A0A841FZB0_9ACTN|nr:hypothetical protein [Phytomonospora endophytica]MBB6038862.1 hypothetical protein [Phytomonospora endophytica]GIG68343.1 hypothetical protein Pen01_46380 [Phytomonospora endophytica]
MRKTLPAAVLALTVLLSGCGEAGPSAEERTAYESRAAIWGVPLSHIYVTEVDGYVQATGGGAGVYADDGFSDHYAAADGRYFQLIVDDDPEITDDSCTSTPVAGTGTPAEVACTRQGDGWYRMSGERHEYAENHDGLVIRANAVTDVPTDALRRAVENAHPATVTELDAMLPTCTPEPCGVIPRGDTPSGGDMPPQDPPHVGG